MEVGKEIIQSLNCIVEEIELRMHKPGSHMVSSQSVAWKTGWERRVDK